MTKEQISDLIEEKLGYTNGWKISDEDYKKHCDEIADAVVSKNNSYTVLATVPYQCCPVCNGRGEVVADGFTSSVYQKCTVCDGQKIIPTAIIPQVPEAL